jgi:hypothetical protein
MVPLYAARVGDLKPVDFVIVDCACGHSGLIHPAGRDAVDRDHSMTIFAWLKSTSGDLEMLA